MGCRREPPFPVCTRRSQGNELILYRGKSDPGLATILVVVPTISVKQGLSNANPWSVMAAKDGSVWLSTRDGLN